MKTIRSQMLITMLAAILLSGCSKKDNNNTTTNPTQYGSAVITVNNKAGEQPLVLNTASYVTAHGDSISIGHFSYYLTNFSLAGGGVNYKESNSYHLLLQETPSTLTFTLDSIPVGNYSSLTFLIGVDSLHNVSGAQTGALDPLNNMFWGWNTGYIQARLDGFSPQSGDPSHTVTLDIGGFSGTNNTVHSITLPLPAQLTVSNDAVSRITLDADALKWFAPTVIDLHTTYKVMTPGDTAKMISDNFANMFSVESVN